MDFIKKNSNNEESKKIWTSEYINQAMQAIEDGYDLKAGYNPFYENDINYRKGNIIFEYTPEEIEEIKKCAKDVTYFANTYAYTMTDDGMVQIKLRDYQEDILQTYQKEKEVVFMAARQIGKCHFFLTNITILNTNNDIIETTIGDLYYKTLKNPTILQRIKHFLYKILNKLN